MRPDDIAAVIDIAGDLGLSYWSRADYIDEASRTDSISLVMGNAEELVVGFIVGRIVPGNIEGSKDAEIYNLGVIEDQQRRALGSYLLRQFLTRCAKAEVSSIWLDVRISNLKAIRFYRKHGFVDTATRPSFYSQPAEDGILMELANVKAL